MHIFDSCTIWAVVINPNPYYISLICYLLRPLIIKTEKLTANHCLSLNLIATVIISIVSNSHHQYSNWTNGEVVFITYYTVITITLIDCLIGHDMIWSLGEPPKKENKWHAGAAPKPLRTPIFHLRIHNTPSYFC